MTEATMETITTGTHAKRLVLAMQHFVAMFGATVLVPILTGFDPSVAIFAAGMGTLLFHLCTGGKVPVFLGSSFAFIPVILKVVEETGDLAYAQGGIIVAGFIYVIIAGIVKLVGPEKIQKIMVPQVIGPMIIVIGFNLIPSAFGMAKTNFLVAGITLATALTVIKFGKGFVGQISILIALLVGYGVSAALNIVDYSPIVEAAAFAMPKFQAPKFSAGAIATIAPIVLAVLMEHLGDITTNSTIVGKNFIKDPGLHRTLLGDGIATMAAGFVGGPANTTYGENSAVLAITKNYDPSLLRLAAIFALCISFVGKLSGVLRSIPTCVLGGISLVLFTMIGMVGVRTIVREKVKPNWKNILVMGSILVIGFGSGFIEAQTGIRLAIVISDTIAIEGLSLAAIVGIILNLILTPNKKEEKENPEAA